MREPERTDERTPKERAEYVRGLAADAASELSLGNEEAAVDAIRKAKNELGLAAEQLEE
jgi:hypothetical protein